MGIVIDEDGNTQTWTAVYWRYHSKSEYEASSLTDALNFLQYGEDYGELSSDSVRGPDGTVVIPNDRIHDVLYKFRDMSEEQVQSLTLAIGGAQ